MSLYKVEGIVLKSKQFGEADSIITLLSTNQGKLQLVSNGSRKVKSKKRGSVQTFSYSSFLVHQGKSLDTITQGDIIESFSYLGQDLDLLVLGSYCCELIDNFLPEKEANLEVFYLLLNTFYLLPFIDKDLLIRAFELKILNLVGYLPVLNQCVNCRRELGLKTFFSSDQGGALCSQCKQVDPYAIACSKGVLAIIDGLIKMDLKKLKILKLSNEEKKLLQKLTETYLRYILEKNLKSWSFIKSLDINKPL